MGNLLPIPCVLALLRLIRRVDAHEDDEDVLFDEFDAVGREQVLTRAARYLLGEGIEMVHDTLRLKAMDDTLVEMLRDHARRRNLLGEEAA